MRQRSRSRRPLLPRQLRDPRKPLPLLSEKWDLAPTNSRLEDRFPSPVPRGLPRGYRAANLCLQLVAEPSAVVSPASAAEVALQEWVLQEWVSEVEAAPRASLTEQTVSHSARWVLAAERPLAFLDACSKATSEPRHPVQATLQTEPTQDSPRFAGQMANPHSPQAYPCSTVE